MEPSALSVRSQMAAASKRIGRLRRIDRAAVVVITLGGIAVVVAVLGILVFVASEAVPLFTSRHADAARRRPDRRPRCTPADAAALRAVGVDEYQKYCLHGRADRAVVFYRLDIGRARHRAAVPGLGRRDRHVVVAQRRRPLRRRRPQRRPRLADAGSLRPAVRGRGAQGPDHRGA